MPAGKRRCEINACNDVRRKGAEKIKKKQPAEKRSIFRALFIPLFLIMAIQAGIFYLAAVYGGIQDSLAQNSADIMSGLMTSRGKELETRFNNQWMDLSGCSTAVDGVYAGYEESYGERPLADDRQRQIQFLRDISDKLINTLRQNRVNGIFMIINDQRVKTDIPAGATKQKYGLCIRDMDQESNFSGTDDLLAERAPSSIVDSLGCSLDSWWEAWYTFDSEEAGNYYFAPLEAAWSNPDADGADLAYISDVYQLSRADPKMIACSIPLTDDNGYPYGVLGVELSVKYLSTLMPSAELNEAGQGCYVLAMQNGDATDFTAIVGSGILYSRCFGSDAVISCRDTAATGGFWLTARGDTRLYGDCVRLNVYNNNNPHENRRLTLLALVENDAMFGHIGRIKMTLAVVSLISLALGLAGITWVSRRFAKPITALSVQVRDMDTRKDFQPSRLGITEIDQLVESIEALNRDVNKNSARMEFFSRMSHDMRTPMNAIISFSSPEMLDGATEAMKDDYLSSIHASGGYLLGLINEVLDITRIENNKTELHLESTQAQRLLETIVPMVEKLAQDKDVRFLTDISVEPELYVMADRQHLEQIVMNLLSNAVKFTPSGGTVSLKVQASNIETGLVRYGIVVADTGIGMSDAFLQRIYVPFEQESRWREGTGLGLSIAKGLVELMKGKIDCVSQKNAGTTFTVTLPLTQSEKPADIENVSAISEYVGLDVLNGKRVLVCEDNQVNLQIICYLLEKYHMVVETAENGQLGLDAFAASVPGSFDVILMDIMMPVLDGLSAAREIRAMNRPDAASIPILAMTANAFSDDVRASSEAGMNAHLSKPVEPQKLYEELIHVLQPKS